MPSQSDFHPARALAPLLFLLAAHPAFGEQPGSADLAGAAAPPAGKVPASEILDRLLQVPVTNLLPGGTSPPPSENIPALDDPAAAQRGMRDFAAFNCIGCHMPNGGGGMGPALSDGQFIYGSRPEDIYLTILQGRPNGMPSWGAVLPNEVIWDLVAYVKSISQPPNVEWGTTVSPNVPSLQQVPAELQQTATPWKYTEQFTKGQKP